MLLVILKSIIYIICQKQANIVVLSGICDMLSGICVGDILFRETLFCRYMQLINCSIKSKNKAFVKHILKRTESKTEGLVSDDYHLMERWMDRLINIYLVFSQIIFN